MIVAAELEPPDPLAPDMRELWDRAAPRLLAAGKLPDWKARRALVATCAAWGFAQRGRRQPVRSAFERINRHRDLATLEAQAVEFAEWYGFIPESENPATLLAALFAPNEPTGPREHPTEGRSS